MPLFPRFIERTEYAQYVTSNNERVNTNPEYYRQRQQIIEHQFGTLKRHRHFDYTLMKGKPKVLGEVYLAFTTYNLGRSLSILGFSGLMERVKAVLLLFFRNSSLSLYMDLLKSISNRFAIMPHEKRCGQSLLFLKG
jgi:Transposase DDE domain